MKPPIRLCRRALLLAAAALPLAACNKTQPAAKFKGIDLTGAAYGNDFKLKDPAGQWRSMKDYQGKAVMIFFGFTQCPDICPTALARAAQVMQLLGKDADRLQVLFVTVDPERDTPAIMKDYVKAFHPSFVGLMTTLEETKAQADNFKVFFAKVPLPGSAIGYTIDHTALSYVLDPQGRLRLALRDSLSAQDVAADIRQLLQQG